MIITTTWVNRKIDNNVLPLNCYVIVVGEFESPNDPKIDVIWAFTLLVGPPKANRSWVTRQNKSSLKTPYE